MSMWGTELASSSTLPIGDEARAEKRPGLPDAPPRRFASTKDERAIEICECVIDITAALYGVAGRELRQPGRSTTPVARVRQIGMYLAHVVLGLSMSDVGKGFGRDRTTVLHACHLIEDMRDDPEFDEMISKSEQVTRAAFRGRELL